MTHDKSNGVRRRLRLPAHCAQKSHFAAGIGLRTFRGPPANAGCAVWHLERLARGFTAFFLALSCSPLAAAHPNLAAAEGEQDGNDKPATICPPICGELY